MHKRLAPLVAAGLTLGSLPFVWIACSSTQSAGTAETALPSNGVNVAKLVKPSEAAFHQNVQPFIEEYCLKCHTGKKAEAELDLSTVKAMAAVTSNPERWSQILQRIKDKEMPPDDAEKIPNDAQRKPVITWLEEVRAYETARTAGDPGTVLARRLSNAEYDYTIRDLTGVDIRPTKEFPVDPANEAGFDNTGESLAMSPALVTKYLEAARNVADHIILAPEGLQFAPFTVVTDDDRDKFGVLRIVDFYRKQGVSIGLRTDAMMAQVLEYADYFAAAWRLQNRAALGRPQATVADFAKEAKLSSKYLGTLLNLLNGPADDVGPVAALQTRWKKLPAPAGGKEPAELATACASMRDFIQQVRPQVRMKFNNLVPSDRLVAAGSQAFVIWKDKQYAENRLTYAGNAAEVDWSAVVATDPVMAVPTVDASKAKYEDAFKRFCAVFPDAFVVYERGRMFLGNAAGDLNGHRYLSAGLHSQMAFFRDDRPLYDLVLDDAQRRELDRLWNELEFISDVPIRQFKQNVWFERGEPPSVMVNSIFNAFRSEDDNLVSEPMVKKLAETYYNFVSNLVVHVPANRGRGGRGGGDNTPLNFRAPLPGTLEAPAEGMVEMRLSPEALQSIKDYYVEMNTRIRALEKAQQAAEPLHVQSMVDFAERAARRPLSKAEKDDLRGFYSKLREQGLSHENAIRDCVVSVLMSPSFSYRVDLPRVAKGPAPAPVQALNDYELASRLSYFLWSSMPDAELMQHAAAGDLHRPEVLTAQARRMLKDPKVRGLATEFGGNWLDIRRFEEHNAVDRERFPVFTNELREAMFEEPVRFFIDVAQHNGSILDFVYGDYTVVNPALAKHYGIPVAETASADDWIRIDGAKKYERGGLLPMAAFLTKNAPGLRTSPVKRGHWVVTKILGERIPAPPPNVPVLPMDETKLGDLTLRQTLAKHREDKTCSSCHNKFDSLGLVFEGFGPVGEVRKTDLAGRPAETSAVFPDGSEGTGLAGLQTYFRTKVEHEFVENLSRKMLSYALGRTLMPSDDLVVKSMREKLSSNGYRFETIVDEIVTSRQFLTKRNSPDPKNGS